MPRIINTDQAPAAIGPYSQAVEAGNLLFISGQLPLNPETRQFAADDIKGQTRQCLDNLQAILKAAGYDISQIVKVTVFLKNIDDFAAMNEVYTDFFSQHKPARAAIAAAALPKNALIEIEAIAVKESHDH